MFLTYQPLVINAFGVTKRLVKIQNAGKKINFVFLTSDPVSKSIERNQMVSGNSKCW